jgi:hypothetical protein
MAEFFLNNAEVSFKKKTLQMWTMLYASFANCIAIRVDTKVDFWIREKEINTKLKLFCKIS